MAVGVVVVMMVGRIQDCARHEAGLGGTSQVVRFCQWWVLQVAIVVRVVERAVREKRRKV